jgi:hypothetical protein
MYCSSSDLRRLIEVHVCISKTKFNEQARKNKTDIFNSLADSREDKMEIVLLNLYLLESETKVFL